MDNSALWNLWSPETQAEKLRAVTSYTRKQIGSQHYVLTTVVGSGRVKVAFDGGPDVGMWDASLPDPWVLKYEGFEAFRRTGDMTAADIELRAFDRERRHPVRMSETSAHKSGTLSRKIDHAAIGEACGPELRSGEPDALDPGLAAIAHIGRTAWQLDEEAMVAVPRGFGWYPHRLRHELIAGPVFEDLGSRLSLVQSRIRVLEDVQEDRTLARLSLGTINRRAIGSALYLEEESRALWSYSSMLIHHETLSWRPSYYANLALLQAAQMERMADGLAEMLKGRVAVASHPVLGDRTEPDPRLCYYDEISAAAESDSPFESPREFSELQELCPQIGLATFGAAPAGIAAEMEFGGDTALIQLHADQPHPAFGPGLLFTLRLPFIGSLDDAMDAGAALTRFEAQSARRTHLQGAWTVDLRGQEQYVPAYSGFRPRALYRPGIIKDEFLALVMRLRALREMLLGDKGVPAEPVGIILRRLGELH